MCGIGGVSLNIPIREKEAEVVERMLSSLHRRGEHSFGYMYATGMDYEMYKEPGPYWRSHVHTILPSELIDEGPSEIGLHTRYATQGDPSKNQNNHPFDFGNFVMAHNGVFYRTEEFDNPTNIETDSFWALYWIQREYENLGEDPNRTAEAIEKGIEHVVGAFAIWLYNKDNGKVYLFRNALKPTKTAIIQGDNYYLFASDRDAINDALGLDMKFGMDGVIGADVGGTRTLREGRLRVKNIRPLPPHTIYSLKEGRMYREKIMRPKPVSPEVRMRFRDDYAHLYSRDYNSSMPLRV